MYKTIKLEEIENRKWQVYKTGQKHQQQLKHRKTFKRSTQEKE